MQIQIRNYKIWKKAFFAGLVLVSFGFVQFLMREIIMQHQVVHNNAQGYKRDSMQMRSKDTISEQGNYVCAANYDTSGHDALQTSLVSTNLQSSNNSVQTSIQTDQDMIAGSAVPDEMWNSIKAEDIELVPISDGPMPAGVEVDQNGNILGEGSGKSPLSEYCAGMEIGDHSLFCKGSGTDVDFSKDKESPDVSDGGVRFNEKCKVNLVYITMPAYFNGIDENKDGVIETFTLGELPDIAGVGDTFTYANYTEDGITPSKEYARRGDKKNDSPQAGGGEYGFEGNIGAATDISTKVKVNESSDGEVEQTDEGLSDNEPQHSMTYGCEPAYSHVQHCESTLLHTALTEEGEVDLVFNPPAGVKGEDLKPKDSCPGEYEYVPYRVLCLDAIGVAKGWKYKFTGQVPKSRCYLDDVTGLKLFCRRNVNITVFVKDIFDRRMEEYADTLIQLGRAPKPGDGETISFDSEYPDDYVATPGICTVCGKSVQCPIIWRDYIREHYERALQERGPCVDDPFCDYESYKQHVYESSGGIMPST